MNPLRILLKLWRTILLVIVFLGELVVANGMVAFEVVTPRHYMRPGIIAVPLRARTDAEITVLANLVSLTPGTLSLDLSEDKKVLYVHGLHIKSPDHLRRQVRRFEDRVLGVFR